ncbi:GTP-binding protein [Metabacillus litoralis]|uniref:CobW family GTP-binding protein n=1 Tax=Metabacillus litoralis TaxID=152268 RepID=UPI0020419702|nr:GTP-binding protein [Metabacillus litoralis]MCM3162245.1 GTP-binding protein [Metabacillus litoralis]
MDKYNGKKPITIITGCLGSGKTTILQEILKNEYIKNNTAIIVNEFGKVGLDHHLLRKSVERTVLLDGGCICCNSREDLEEELKLLLNMYETGKSKFDRIIIETTGMADPSPILFTVLTNPLLQHRFIIDCVIATVDAKNGLLQFKNNPELIKQLTVADKVIITKTDITPNEEIIKLLDLIREISPSCEFQTAIHGNVNPSIIVGNNASSPLTSPIKGNTSTKNHYSPNIHSISFTIKKALDWTAFGLWLSMLLHAKGEDVLRVKGLIDVGEKGPIVLNGVQHIIHPPQHLEEWPTTERNSHIIFILRSIDPHSIEKSLKSFQTFLDTEIELLELQSVM